MDEDYVLLEFTVDSASKSESSIVYAEWFLVSDSHDIQRGSLRHDFVTNVLKGTQPSIMAVASFVSSEQPVGYFLLC
jgi:hypothetical protein